MVRYFFLWTTEFEVLFLLRSFQELWSCYLDDKAWEGVGVVASARKLIGATDPLQAEPGTIRGDLAVQTGRWGSLPFGIWSMSYTLHCRWLQRIAFSDWAMNHGEKRSKYELFCRNVVHGSDSPENGKREIGKAFDALLLDYHLLNLSDMITNLGFSL